MFILGIMGERRISELPSETIEALSSVLEKGPTIDWKKLMTKGFASLYSPQDVDDFRKENSPAKALLDDLIGREVKLQDLVGALRVIGNERAISIIHKGSYYF